MDPNTSTSTDAQPDKSAPNGISSSRHGRPSPGVTPSVRFRLLAGGLTKLSGLRTLMSSYRESGT